MTIARIFPVSYKAVLANMLRGRPYISDRLNQLAAEGRIRREPIGPTGPALEPIIEVSNTISWTSDDEQANPSPEDKIALAANLIDYGLRDHDDLLLELVGESDIVISQEYTYFLGDIFTFDHEGATVYSCKIFTPFYKKLSANA